VKSVSPEDVATFELKFGKVKRTRGKPRPPKPRELTAEETFADAWHSDPLPGAQMLTQYRFHPERKWAFDFCWPGAMLAVELEGFGSGVTIGRHQTYPGFREDCEKYTAAVLNGWRVLRFMSGEKKHVRDWLRTVKMALCGVKE
jgi:hypothetical protein